MHSNDDDDDDGDNFDGDDDDNNNYNNFNEAFPYQLIVYLIYAAMQSEIRPLHCGHSSSSFVT